MHAVSTITALATLASVATATNGFNYASTNGDGSGKDQATFEADFKAAQNLPGTNGQFNSARLYTMIQGGTASDPISAIPAAIATDTTLLLGLWASAGDASFDLELKALQAAIDTYGEKLKDIVVGISIGSEDLYRITPTSQASSPNPGAQPDTIVNYISKVRELIKGTVLADAKLGHVDTWTSWANSSNNAVIEAVDWLGFDGYPYFQDGDDNGVENGKALFDESVEKTKAAAGGKPVWITETGWPVSGSTYNKAVASVDNAEVYWQTVGCPLFNVENVWWYILSDSGSTPEFGVIKSLDSEPYYNLTCDASSTSSSSSASASATGSSTATGSASSATHTGKSSIILSPTSAASTWNSSTSQPGAASGSSSVSNIAPYPTGSASSSSSSGSNSTSSGHASTTGSSSSSSSGNSTSGSAATTGSASSSVPSTVTSSAARLTSVGVTVAAIAAAFAMI